MQPVPRFKLILTIKKRIDIDILYQVMWWFICLSWHWMLCKAAPYYDSAKTDPVIHVVRMRRSAVTIYQSLSDAWRENNVFGVVCILIKTGCEQRSPFVIRNTVYVWSLLIFLRYTPNDQLLIITGRLSRETARKRDVNINNKMSTFKWKFKWKLTDWQ